MSLTLTTGNTLKGKAGTASAVTYTILGDSVTTTDAFQVLGQGQLASSTGDLLTTTPVPASTQLLINEILLANTTASPVTGIVLYLNGTTASNQIVQLSLVANGSATYSGGKWTTYDSGGGILGGAGIVTSVTAADGSITIAGTATNPTVSRAALTGDVTAPAGSNVTTLAAGSASVLNSGTLPAGRMPALTGDVTTSAGSVATTIKNDVALAGNPTTTTQSANNNSTRIATTAYVDTADALKVPTSRTLTTTAPLTIDAGASADLSANRILAVSDATFTTRGTLTATEKIALNSQDGRTSTGTSPRVFRPGDYMVGNTYDPTGSSNSTTAFQAMMTAVAAFNDRCTIQLAPGVWKVDHDVLKNFGTNNPSVSIIGPGRGLCILLPNAAPTGNQAMITFNTGTTGGDALTLRGFTIYNTSGTPYTAGSGILTNGADGIDISEVAMIDLFRDIQVSGQPYTITTNGTTSLTSISPAVSAADNGRPVSGAGIPPGSTFTFVSSSSGTIGSAATNSTTETRYLGNSIKVSIQKMVSFNTNGNGSGVGIYVNNGLAGDTYMGPDIVMSDGGGTTRRRACIELVETGHYEITQANLTGSQLGILIDPGTSQIVAFGFHTNVLCDSNTVNGMRVDATTATSTIKNIKSVNSWYSGTTVINGSAAAAGVITAGAGAINGFTFTTDRFLNNRTHGFQHGAGTDFRWSDCDMKGNSSSGSGNADGLNVAANIGNWSINGGKFGGTDTVPTAGNQRYGINVAAGTGNNIKISPDDLSGNVTGPLSLGATGTSVFVNGCPGLAPSFARGSATAAITTAEVVVASITIPKNSVRVGTTINIYGQGLISNTTTQSTWTSRVRMGTTTLSMPIVGSDVQTSGIIARSSFPLLIFGSVTFYAIGAGGTALGHLQLVGGVGAAGIVTTGSSGLAAAVTVDTTADRLCEFTIIGAAGTPSITIHNAVVTVNF